MNKLTLICLIGLAIVSACDSSCICAAQTNTCTQCIDPNSSMDPLMLYCPCNQGFYSSYNAQNRYICVKSLVPNTSLDVCTEQASLQIKNIVVDTQCGAVTNPNNQDISVNSSITLDFTATTLTSTCVAQFTTQIQYLNIITQQYQVLPSQYVTYLSNGSALIYIPIEQFYAMTSQGTVNTASVFSNILQLNVIISEGGYVLRNHVYKLVLFTNSQKVTTFAFDISQQETSGCNETSTGECSVITNVTTIAELCSDQTCNNQLTNPSYTVGDYLYAKIAFADSSYTKTLSVNSVLLGTGNNQIYDLTSYCQQTPVSEGVIISLPMTIPCASGMIQIQTTINSNSRRNLRSLQNSNSTVASTDATDSNSKSNFNIQVHPASANSTSTDANAVTSTNSTSTYKSASSIIGYSFAVISSLIVIFTF